MYRRLEVRETEALDPLSLEIEATAGREAFGKPLIANHFRGLIAEAIVQLALGDDWRWCSADYASWDFDNAAGVRLEVKQSAARQSWKTSQAKRSRCCFDIRARDGRWEDGAWIGERRRNAQLYIFAYHSVEDESADHRNPAQWTFFVIAESRLPQTKTVGLAPLSRLVSSCSFDELAGAVKEVAMQVKANE